MPYTTNELIANSYYLSGIVSRDFETVSGPQIGNGLQSLNSLLADKTVDDGMLPYYLTYTFDAVVGEQVYFIPDLIDIDTIVFYLDGVRYSMRKNGRKAYFGSPRAENIKSLPFNWHMERCFGGANVYLYFLPDKNYPMRIWGLFRLQPVVLGQDLSLTFDRFYLNYTEFQLADRLCITYSYTTPPGVIRQLREYEKLIDKQSGQMDLAQRTISVIDKSHTGLNYGQVNLGHGWTVS